MPQMINMRLGPVTITVQYFTELLTEEENGCLPRDMPAHALWYYYVCAMRAYDKAKTNLVYEDEASLVFTVDHAKNLLNSIANMYGVKPEEMIRYWPVMEQQRMKLGGGDTLPSAFKFQFNLN